MLDFEKLIVYQKAKELYKQVDTLLLNQKGIDRIIKDQLNRASLSIILNIAEGTSRFSKIDRCKFYVIARGSVFECYAVFDVLEMKLEGSEIDWIQLKKLCEEISKMLFGLISKLKPIELV